MDSVNIIRVADKKLISSSEIARLYGVDHTELYKCVEALCKFDPYERVLFQKVEGGYLMEKGGFMAVLAYMSLDKEVDDDIKTEVCKMLDKEVKEEVKDSVLKQDVPVENPPQIFTVYGSEVKLLTDFQIGGKNYHLYDAGLQNLLVKATDLCEWLNFTKRSWGGYDGNRITKSLDESEKVKVILVNESTGRPHPQWLITLDVVKRFINSNVYYKKVDKDIRQSLNKMIDEINASAATNFSEPTVTPETNVETDVEVQEQIPNWFEQNNNDDMNWLDELPPTENVTPSEEVESEPASALQLVTEQKVLGKDFKIYGTVEEPLFLAKDVAEWIEYDKSSVHKLVASVDEDEKVRKIVPTLGGVQESWFLTEDGLYEVLMQSRKPIAKKFKSQVKTILKAIRKTGMYAVPAMMSDFKSLIVQNTAILQQTNQLLVQNSQMITQTNHILAQLTQSAAERMDRISASLEKSNQDGELISKMINQLGRNVTMAIKSANITPVLTAGHNDPPAENDNEPDITGCITLKAAAEKHGFYTIKTGKPNYAVIADILKYGCGVTLTIIPNYKDDYIVVKCVVSSSGEIRPCIFLTAKAQNKLSNYIALHIHKILKVETYKRACNKKLRGDWRFEYIQFPGKKKHIIANQNGMPKRFAA